MIILVGPRLRLPFLILLIVLAMDARTALALDEVVDDYENETRVSFTYQVIQNATLDVMELNWTVGTGGPDDLTLWTEVDVEGDLTVNVTHVVFTTLRRDSDALIYKDWGAGYFGDFMINATLDPTHVEAGDGSSVVSFYPLMVGNSPTKDGVIGGEGVMIEMYQSASTDNRLRYRFRQRKGGAWSIDIFDATVYVVPFTHYLSVYRVGAQLTLDVFSDPAHTVRIEHLTAGGADLDTYQYSHASIGYSAPGDPADHASGSISLIDFGVGVASAYETLGYFNTTNYLTGLGYNATVLLTDTAIPSGSINAEISPDGSTWTDLGTLATGYGSLDLRALGLTDAIMRFNFTRGLSTETPRLAQVRLIHEGPGAGVGNVTFQNVTGAWALHNLSSILTLRGTLDSGDLNSTLDIDGDSYSVSEVVGAPGFLVSFNWTAVDLDAGCLWIVINAWYDGNLAHDVDIELYNHTALAWVGLGHILDGVGFEWFNASVYGLRIPLDFLNGAGDVWGRLNHVSAGNINHDLFIEYLKLHIFIPNGVAPTITTAGVVDVTPFIAIGLILALAMYLLADRVRK